MQKMCVLYIYIVLFIYIYTYCIYYEGRADSNPVAVSESWSKRSCIGFFLFSLCLGKLIQARSYSGRLRTSQDIQSRDVSALESLESTNWVKQSTANQPFHFTNLPLGHSSWRNLFKAGTYQAQSLWEDCKAHSPASLQESLREKYIWRTKFCSQVRAKVRFASFNRGFVVSIIDFGYLGVCERWRIAQ